jgi:hypothetical protein
MLRVFEDAGDGPNKIKRGARAFGSAVQQNASGRREPGEAPVRRPIFQVRQPRAFASAVLLSILPLLPLTHTRALAQERPGASQFVKDARNPLGDQASFQVQPNFNFGVGQDRDTQYVFNIQPIVPIHLPGAWTLFSRTILPLIDQPGSAPGQGYTFGIGDIQPTLFLSPPSSKGFIWGVGPVFQFPSASSTSLGTGKWEIGPTAAAILTGAWWQVGAQVNNLWSFAGDASRPAVNTMLLEPLVNVFLPADWYLTFGPQVTANWKAGSGNQWTVPVGGGIGRAFTIGRQRGTAQIEAYSNVERPAGGPRWSMILTVQFVFPQ